MNNKEAIFNSLIDRDLGLFRGAAYRILGNAADADEAIQEALLVAWRKFDSFKKEAKLSSWVYRIIVNRCYDLLRSRKREADKLSHYADSFDSAGNENVLLDALETAIAELPTIYREAISIGYLSGKDGVEAAEILDCSVNTLHQRIHKAKRLLKAKLEKSKNE